MKELLSRFEEHLLRKHFFLPKERILIACSGGPDSTALFYLLKSLASRNQWRLGLLHFNHQLRPSAAKKDELFVRNLARKHRVAFYGGQGSVKEEARKTKTSIEECARHMRYDFFLSVAREKRFSKIVFAHTQDDQAETVLMRLFQGTGPRGLSGIREQSTQKGVTLIRPLLAFSKKEILRGLAQAKIPYRLDLSNRSLRFVRNRIRLKIMPELKRLFNPRLAEALARFSSIAAEENSMLEDLETKAWRRICKKSATSRVELRRSIFLKLPPPLQFRIAERALKQLDSQSGLSFEAWQRLQSGMLRSRYRVSLPKDIDFELTPRRLSVYKKNQQG